MTSTVTTIWNQQNRTPVALASATMIAAIAIADWRTPPYVSLGFLYLFPVMLAAGFLPRPAIGALGVICAALSEAFSSLDPTGRIVRVAFEILALSGSGLFVSELVRSRRLNVQIQQRFRALVDTSPAAIVLVDQQGLIELANRAATDLLVPGDRTLLGQSIGTFLPDLQNVLRRDGNSKLRASMQCQVHPINGEEVVAEVWFSTWKENGTSKLAAIIGDITEEQTDVPAPLDSIEGSGAERPRLTERQIAVLRLVFEGLSNTEIASRLNLTASAVKNTIQQLFSKTGVNKRSQMVRVALEHYRDLI